LRQVPEKIAVVAFGVWLIEEVGALAAVRALRRAAFGL
jgi:hypothetical protein